MTGSDLAAQDAPEVGHGQGVAVHPPRDTSGSHEVGKRHRRSRAAVAVDLNQHESVTSSGDWHDGVAVITLEPLGIAHSDVVGQDGDLLAERAPGGPGSDIGDIAQRPDRSVAPVAQRAGVDINQAGHRRAGEVTLRDPAGRPVVRDDMGVSQVIDLPIAIRCGDGDPSGVSTGDPDLSQHLHAVRRQRALSSSLSAAGTPRGVGPGRTRWMSRVLQHPGAPP